MPHSQLPPLRAPWRCALTLLLCASCWQPPAIAASDLLALPALSSPLASKGLLLAVASAGPRLFAAGERGIIVYSDDQGASWKQARVPVSVTLTALYFATPELGWAAGHDGVILHSEDGGQSWRKQFDGNRANALILADLRARLLAARAAGGATATLENALADAESSASFGPAMPLLGLWFRDRDYGLAVGAFGQLFQTNNGGRSWTCWNGRIDNPDGLHYNSIAAMADGSLLIAGEGGKLRRSRDAGASWTSLDTGYAGHLYGALTVPGGTRIIAYGFGGTVLRSDDDGKSWQALPKLLNKPLIGAAQLSDGTLLLAAGDGRLLRSADRGDSFAVLTKSPGRPLAALLPQRLGAQGLLGVGAGGPRLLGLPGLPGAAPLPASPPTAPGVNPK